MDSGQPLARLGNGTAAGNDKACCGPDLQLQVLQHAWLRKAHPLADTNPAAEKEQRRHLDAALKSGVPFDVIAAACKAYAAAYDVENNGRRFLGSLADWLGSKGWELPPPDRSGRKSNSHGNGKHHHYRKSKPKDPGDAFLEEVGLESGPDGVLRERQGRPQ
jgi:hypothetical protein